MQEQGIEKGALNARTGKTGRLAVADREYDVNLVEAKKRQLGFSMWTIWNSERAAGEALDQRIKTLDAARVLQAIGRLMRPEVGFAQCAQQQIALELSMNKGNVSRALKALTARPVDATDDPLTQELVRRVPGGFVINPQFAVVGNHARAWEIWYRNAPKSLSVSDQEIAAAKRIEGRKAMTEKKARYIRDKGEIRAKRRAPHLELVA